jgi:1-aminocyclopropane-1-carboxylate deaminase
MKPPDLSAITIDNITGAIKTSNIEVDVLRLDKIHTLISGNKWFKLHNYLEKFSAEKKQRLITFGGAWSNHIIATAAACAMEGIPVLGIIRGERPSLLSPVLEKAIELGMELVFVDRASFAKGIIPAGIERDTDLIVPQGGYGKEGMLGASMILDHCDKGSYTHFCCAVGTGTMMAGIVNAAIAGQAVIGYSVMKNNPALLSEMEALLVNTDVSYSIDHDFHFGGYAKTNEELIRFMNHFYEKTGIPTDIVYTARLFYGVIKNIEQGKFPDRSRILLIHSGGLTGNSSLENGTLIF